MNSVRETAGHPRLRVLISKSVDPSSTSPTFNPNSWTRFLTMESIGDVMPIRNINLTPKMDETDTICADRRRNATYGFCGLHPSGTSGPSPRASRRDRELLPTSTELTSYAQDHFDIRFPRFTRAYRFASSHQNAAQYARAECRYRQPGRSCLR